jgi:cytochrome c
MRWNCRAQGSQEIAVRFASGLLVGVTLTGVLAAGTAQASLPLAQKSGCMACHIADKRYIGPSFKEIAAKYKGRADAMAFLSQRVRKGGPGSWGVMPMVPNDVSKLSDTDLKTLLTWILATPP